MILEMDNWHMGYSQIQSDCRSGEVWILVRGDVDALAAARIFSFLLRADSISYQIKPCNTVSQLHSLLKEEKTTNLKACVLLNMGASHNLTKLFRPGLLQEDCKIFVMDCRRPVHLANVYAGQNVVVFWDDTCDETGEIPSDGDNLSGAESDDEDETTDDEDDDSDSDDDGSDDDNDEGEAEFGADSTSVSRNKRKEPFESTDVDNVLDQASGTSKRTRGDENSEEDEESLANESAVSKGSKPDHPQSDEKRDGDESLANESSASKPEPTPRQLHEERRKRLKWYYHEGHFFGTPAAYVAYRLATQLRFHENSDLLWLACIGLTDAHLHARIDMAGYASLSLSLKQSIQRLFPSDVLTRVQNAVYAESLSSSGTQAGNNQQNPTTRVTTSENGKLLAQDDFRFFLLRHSSLYDSMVYSQYVSTKLQLHTSRGMQLLQELLAKMGFPIRDSKQPYAFLKPQLKRVLREKFEQYAEEYGLTNLVFTSFVRITGFKSLISAADMSLGISALLDSDSVDAFDVAYDSLFDYAGVINGGGVGSGVGGGSGSGGTSGLQAAMAQRKAIVQTAISLAERRDIVRLRHFRYAFINCSSSEAKQGGGGAAGAKQRQHQELYHLFCKPLALTSLAQWLMDMHRENGKWTGNKSRPLVLCAENPSKGTYMIVGYAYPDHAGQFSKNRFGKQFQSVCDSMGGSEFVHQDSFDANVVEVPSKEAQRFIEQLHYMMDNV